jgi:hypothetical protein
MKSEKWGQKDEKKIIFSPWAFLLSYVTPCSLRQKNSFPNIVIFPPPFFPPSFYRQHSHNYSGLRLGPALAQTARVNSAGGQAKIRHCHSDGV